MAKLLANRLAPRLHELISINQSAFVKDLPIQDNFFLVQQTAKLLHPQRIPSILLKLDISKAFDSVACPFLLEVPRHRSFGYRWINLIALLLCTSSSRVLINGSPSTTITHARGLRQGDPISLMLFLPVINVLEAMFRKLDAEKILRLLPHAIKNRTSLFVDDVALFLGPTPHDLRSTRFLLQLFRAAS